MKFCQVAPSRKMILRVPAHVVHEKCTSADYTTCPAAKDYHEDFPTQSRCPFLQESLSQYCAAAPVIKFLPYSESVTSRCGNENHRYCELFLSIADPGNLGPAVDTAVPGGSAGVDTWVGGLRFPARLAYAQNHMWLDLSEEGTCHVGVDTFLVRVLGPLERIHFVTSKGACLPEVILSTRKVEVHLLFPIRIQLTGSNTHLRIHPERLSECPYSLGWLFEGRLSEKLHGEPVVSPHDELLEGDRAAAWLRQECRRLVQFILDRQGTGPVSSAATAPEGEILTQELLEQLDPGTVLDICKQFLTPQCSLNSNVGAR